ncbi:MAG: 50S ribosomal protein L21 [Patescibacteria group bacterium]|nr:50S ribosomal protein L21 [Patescibacteria group bacterium]
MFAVIKTGGKQYLVKENDLLKIEKIDRKVGQVFSFDEILLFVDEKNKTVQIGQPLLNNIKVKAKVLEQGRNKKISVIKYKPKVRYRRKKGHRQLYTKVKILEIISK